MLGGVWYTSVYLYYIKVLCGECGIRQSSCIILKFCVGSVVYSVYLYYINVLCGECGMR